MNRRSFFRRAIGAVAAAVAAPFLPKPLDGRAIAFNWERITPRTPTVGGIDTATFAFWRNRQAPYPLNDRTQEFDALYDAMRQVHRECRVGNHEDIFFFDPARGPFRLTPKESAFDAVADERTRRRRVVGDVGGLM